LYRLEGIFTRYGGSVTRTTLARWLIQLSLQLQPLINLMQRADSGRSAYRRQHPRHPGGAGVVAGQRPPTG
jgi:hypothetical protein